MICWQGLYPSRYLLAMQQGLKKYKYPSSCMVELHIPGCCLAALFPSVDASPFIICANHSTYPTEPSRALSLAETDDMEPPIGNGHLIDACIALAIVVLFQAAYCMLKRQTATTSRFQLWMLLACASFFGLLGCVFLGLGTASQHFGSFKAAYAMLICCKGTSVLSIWCFEVRH